MWQILSEKDKKKYTLLDALYRKYDPVTIQNLSEFSGLSQRSVLNYLDELKKDLIALQGEILSSNEGIRMRLPDHIGMDHFQRNLLRESMGYQILEFLFFQGEVSCSDLEERFFLSPSSLERLLKKIRKSLEPYNIKLSRSPVAVRGPEFFIQRFFTRYFTEAYTYKEWPFKNLDKETLQSLLISFPPYCKEYKRFIKKKDLLFQFAVSLTRSQKGYPHPTYPVSSFTENKLLEIQQNLTDKLAGFPLKKLLPEAVSRELSLMKLQYTTDYYKDRLHKDPVFQESIQQLISLIHDTTELFRLPSPEYWPFLIEMYKILQLYTKGQGRNIPPSHLLFRSRDFIIVTHHQVEYPFFYTYVTSYFRSILHSRGLSATDNILEELYYALLCHNESLTKHLFTNFKTCKVLLYSHLSYNHAKTVEDVLIANFNRMIDVEIYRECELSADILDKYHFDLLLSTESVEIDTKSEVLYLHFHERGYQISSIYKAISAVVEKKKENQMKRIRTHMAEKELSPPSRFPQ